MKSNYKLLINSLLIIVLIIGCEDESHVVDYEELVVKNISYTECQDNSNETSNTNTCLTLKSKENNYLEISHLNTMFSCGTEQIEIETEIKNDTVFIFETDLGPYTYCYCWHNLNFEIGPLKNKTYVMKIIGCETSYNRDTIIIDFQYSDNLVFSNCN